MHYTESTWNLSSIQPKDMSRELARLDKQASQLERYKSKLSSLSSKQFLALLKKFEAFKEKTSALGCYAYLKFTEDSSHQKAVAQLSQVETSLTRIHNRLLFFSFWFKDLPEKKAQQLINASGKYHYYLDQIRRQKPYTLKESEEKIINIKDITGVSALNKIYTIVTSQFRFRLTGRTYTHEELVGKVKDPSSAIRKQAYLVLLEKYKENKDLLGEIYKTLVADWQEECIHLRKYKSPINVRNVANDIPDEAVDALLAVCERNEHVFQQFFEIKRKRLGLKKLRRFDLYAPLANNKEKKIPYDTAVRTVLDCYGNFSPAFRKAAESIIRAGHIHSLVQKNKQGGAFCCGVTTKIPPYILLSYTGKLRDVSTLAHELGHGVHHILAGKQTQFTADACLPLAETASIFGELLLSEHIMKKDPRKAKELLFAKLEDIYATVTRQAGFVLFEKKAHQLVAEGKTVEELSEIYLAGLRKQLGPKIQIDSVFAYEWLYVPHIFHSPFYCYAYAFGNLLVLALWEMYQEDHSFAGKIIEMLAKGSSESPLQITKALGVDITSEAFWQGGFDVITKMIHEVR